MEKKMENERGNKVADRMIESYKKAIKFMGVFAEEVKKWDGKVYDRRFRTAIRAMPPIGEDERKTWCDGPCVDDDGRCFVVEYRDYNGPDDCPLHRIVWVSLDEMLTIFVGQTKKPRINAQAILDEMECEKEFLEKQIADVEKSRAEIKTAHAKLEQIKALAKELKQYDRDVLIAYGISPYDLNHFNI